MGKQVEFPQSSIAVDVKELTIAYRSYKERPTTLKETLLKFVETGQWKHFETFNAVEKVSFQVKRGEIFGIIGSNGAGKSTLLKAISGVLPPADGEVTVNGKVDSLISLGAGFDSELDAIENIYLNSSLYGLSRDEITKRIPGILEFAELEEFATTPIKYYSSGMSARLGFSVAIDRDPDILIVDEVLAVGDERFQKKCNKVFDRFIEEKKTIIMVSHAVGTLAKMSDQILLMSKGHCAFLGNPEEALEVYRDKDYQTALVQTA